jgi:hypothetical protein
VAGAVGFEPLPTFSRSARRLKENGGAECPGAAISTSLPVFPVVSFGNCNPLDQLGRPGCPKVFTLVAPPVQPTPPVEGCVHVKGRCRVADYRAVMVAMPIDSVLSASLEAKRLALVKAHNRGVACLIPGLLALVILTFTTAPWGWSHSKRIMFGGGVCVFFVAEFYGLYRVFKHDARLCRELGFLCPHCQKPLYEPRSLLNATGRCPKCRQSDIASVYLTNFSP